MPSTASTTKTSKESFVERLLSEARAVRVGGERGIYAEQRKGQMLVAISGPYGDCLLAIDGMGWEGFLSVPGCGMIAAPTRGESRCIDKVM